MLKLKVAGPDNTLFTNTTRWGNCNVLMPQL